VWRWTSGTSRMKIYRRVRNLLVRQVVRVFLRCQRIKQPHTTACNFYSVDNPHGLDMTCPVPRPRPQSFRQSTGHSIYDLLDLDRAAHVNDHAGRGSGLRSQSPEASCVAPRAASRL
jgi:hypothetical protein